MGFGGEEDGVVFTVVTKKKELTQPFCYQHEQHTSHTGDEGG